MNVRSKWLATALLAAVGLSATVGTAVISQSAAQPPPTGGRGGGGPAADPGQRGRPAEQPGPRGGGGGGFGGMAGGVMPVRGWEYKVVHGILNNSNAEADLNKLGADGWEACATGERGALVFKRPKGMPAGGGAIGGAIGGAFGGGGQLGGGFGSGIANLDTMVDATIRRLDRNADGKVTREEVGDNARLGGDFNAIDANKDGSIDAAEYRKHVESRTGGRGADGFNPFGVVGGGGPGGIGGRGPGAGSELQVIRLRNAQADDLARLLKEVFAGPQARASVSADARSNSLIVNADPDTLKAIQALVGRLDEPGPNPPQKQ